jgi:S-DNA-T family DNA segregation ATPase FtsK/SpoIIIE
MLWDNFKDFRLQRGTSNMAGDQRMAKNGTEGTNGGIAGKVVLIVFLVAVLLIFLALVSYAPEDADHLADGIEGYVIRNWIGYFGASVSWFLFLLLGFAAYPVTLLLLLSFGRRLIARARLRAVRWDYWLAFGLVSVGAAMLLGIWPDLWANAAESLNISQTPGGVIGQKLCAPRYGWMRMILNPAGSAIVAGALIVVGLVVLWIYDWHELAVTAWQKRQEEAGAKEEDRQESLREKWRRKREEQAAKERRKRDMAARQPRPAATEPAELPTPAAAEPSETAAADAATPAATTARRASKPKLKYKLPPLDLLQKGDGIETTAEPEEIERKKIILQETLDSFGIEATVGETTSGPRVTLFEVETAPGVNVERISRISKNIAMELQAVSLRILAPIPCRKSVGIEVPNINPATVHIHNLMTTSAWKTGKYTIPLVIGRNISGKCVVLDLAKAPHLLIAGATGSGKSVCINAMIMSLLYRFSPEELRLILVDPKVVEFSCYKDLPHLVVPVITESKKVPLALRWIINEMQRRYQVFSRVGARNLAAFNARPVPAEPLLDERGEEIPAKLPYIVLIIDELADIMMTSKAEIETSLARIAQLSRATGIHTIIATQRPSVNVITGTIKANYPTRIAFQVTSQVDSRTILDGKGAESLLGRGDMLFKPPGAAKLERIQSALVEDHEIEEVAGFVAGQAEQDFNMEVFKTGESSAEGVPGGEQLNEEDEQLITDAIDIIKRDRRATTSYIQRCLRIGYNRAALIMEILEQRGIVGPQIGSAPREILIDTGSGVEEEDDDVDEDSEQDNGI